MDDLRKNILRSFRDLTFVNVGAYNGVDCNTVKRAFSKSRSIAVEPCPQNAAKLRKSPKLEVIEVAVCDRNGEIILHRPVVSEEDAFTSQANSVLPEFLAERSYEIKTVTVKAVTMTRLLEMVGAPVQVVKINCEGGEYLIFQKPEFLEHVDVVDVSMHKKSAALMSDRYEEFRQHNIEGNLRRYGFELRDGPLSKDVEEDPRHITQLWVKQ